MLILYDFLHNTTTTILDVLYIQTNFQKNKYSFGKVIMSG